MRTRTSLSTLAIIAFALSACASNPPVEPVPEPELVDTTTEQRAVVQPVTIDGVLDGSEIDPNSIAARAPLERVIFFDYDKAELRPEFLDIVTQHGRFLAENPDG